MKASSTIKAYHHRTSHRFEAYAPGPETLDWEAQPNPFRKFNGTQTQGLPPFSDILHKPTFRAAFLRPLSDVHRQYSAFELNLESLSALLHLALGITAWKSNGIDRWAVRANPSSGNLHPIEAYLMVHGMQDMADGLYHYRSEDHVLEYRGALHPETEAQSPFLYIGLSSVMWRETWKYGERAFRYCQLDTGHAVASVSYAAATLGWTAQAQTSVVSDLLAHTLGLDRPEDFSAGKTVETEQEEPEVLLRIHLGSASDKTPELPGVIAWYGNASCIDPYPMYTWPEVAHIAKHTRHQKSHIPCTLTPSNVQPASSTMTTDAPIVPTILKRRSAQRFNAAYHMPKAIFFDLLASLNPRADGPWQALGNTAAINLVFFVQRVEGLEPGLYLLTRVSDLSQILQSEMKDHFRFELLRDSPLLRMKLFSGINHQRLIRSLHCHQEIAGNACFALAMLAPFARPVEENPASYRDLYREAGLIGQVLYLQAEAHGLRGTGIGCYFDDAVHDLLNLHQDTFKSLYHFTVGLPIEDIRIETVVTSFMET